jgi:glycosyltransferase involved in cell wall biosynthesis
MHFYILNNSILVKDGMSGSDRRALEYSKYFISKQQQVTLIIPEVAKDRYKNTGVNFIISEYGTADQKPSLLVLLKRSRLAQKACASLTLSKQDVIYSSSDIIADSLPSLALKKKNPQARLICGLHLLAPTPFKGFKNAFTPDLKIPGPREIYYYWMQRFVIGKLRQYADLVLVSNKLDQQVLLDLGLQGQRILVAYGAVDKELIDKAEVSTKKFDVVFVGRAHEQKGFLDLFQIVKLISQEKKDFTLALISDMTKDKLESILETYGIKPNVKFFGFKDGIEKFQIIKQSRLLIFPSYYESFGMVILEAMACGLPVVAYDLPVYRGIFVQGMLTVKIKDMRALSNLVLDLLEDDKKRQALSFSALELSRGFSWARPAENILLKLQKKEGEGV